MLLTTIIRMARSCTIFTLNSSLICGETAACVSLQDHSLKHILGSNAGVQGLCWKSGGLDGVNPTVVRWPQYVVTKRCKRAQLRIEN